MYWKYVYAYLFLTISRLLPPIAILFKQYEGMYLVFQGRGEFSLKYLSHIFMYSRIFGWMSFSYVPYATYHVIIINNAHRISNYRLTQCEKRWSFTRKIGSLKYISIFISSLHWFNHFWKHRIQWGSYGHKSRKRWMQNWVLMHTHTHKHACSYKTGRGECAVKLNDIWLSIFNI